MMARQAHSFGEREGQRWRKGDPPQPGTDHQPTTMDQVVGLETDRFRGMSTR